MTIELLPATEMGPNPNTFFAVAKTPAPLAGMAYPVDIDWPALHASGYRHVVCLTDNEPTYRPAPLDVLYAAALQDLCGGANPRDPAREERCIRAAVELIIARLVVGEGVAVHCAGGTGRTGTVIACALKALGLSVEDVLTEMEVVNAARQKRPGWKGWPESAWQRELLERF